MAKQVEDGTQKTLKATHFGELNLGGIPIPCAVLENGDAILTQREFLSAIGRSGKQHEALSGPNAAPPFVEARNLQPYCSETLRVPPTPLKVRLPDGRTVHSYRAELLPEVCEVYVRAQLAGALHGKQQHVARQCQVLLLAMAKVGITALVHEATGYKKRPMEYAELLEMLVAKELMPWVKRFPDDFFKEMCRLRKWEYTAGPLGLPRCVGHDINKCVYSRLPQDVRTELRRLTEEKDSARLHQGLSDNFGVKWLDKHLNEVIALMKAAQDWRMFRWLFGRVFPKHGEQSEFWLDDSAD